MTYSIDLNHKCRILYLVGQLGVGGLEQQLVCLLEKEAVKRYLPLVLSWNLQEGDANFKRIRDLGVKVLAFPPGCGSLTKLAVFARIVSSLRPEVIHSFNFYTNFPAYFGGKITGAVAIGALRSDYSTEKKDAGAILGRLCARWPSVHISNNQMAVENVKRTGGVFCPQKLVVVRNGLNLLKFKNVTIPLDRTPKILSVGSLLPVKRWDRLLMAAADLKNKGQEFFMRIVGEGPLRTSLEQQSLALGLTDQVEFLGQRTDVPTLLGESWFLVHTSDREGCPNVVAEAMACGRAVVATDVGDIPFLVKDGKTGFVVGKEDGKLLSQRMESLIQNVELCRRMGEAGRVMAEKEFGSDRLVSETLAVYRIAGWEDI